MGPTLSQRVPADVTRSILCLGINDLQLVLEPPFDLIFLTSPRQ